MAGDCVPIGWHLVKLGDLGEVNRGRSRHRPRYAEHLYGGLYPFIQTGDIKSSGGRITAYQQTYSEAGLAQSRMWPTGTLCITIAANIAETGILTFPACFPDSVIGFVPDASKCDIRFVEYTFRCLRHQIQHEASGSVQDNINLQTIDRLRFPLPTLTEQRAIAHILGTLDDKIELNRRMSETLEAMARALFKSWFVDFDPVRAKAEGRDPGLPRPLTDLFPGRLVDSELGEIPEGWEVKGLDQIARFLNGLALQKYPPVGDRSLPVVKIAQLRSGRADGSDRASADLDPDYIVADGDILFSWSGSLECVLWAGGPGALNQHLFKVTSASHPRWLCYFAVHHHLDDFQHIAAGKATTMGHIQRHHLSDAKIVVPPESVPREIDQRIAPLFESLWKREVESRTLAALRDTLLPKLISGELRVQNAEKLVERAV
jgi:type I restriction enzyme S subunit